MSRKSKEEPRGTTGRCRYQERGNDSALPSRLHPETIFCRGSIVIPALLIILVFLVFGQTVHHDFVNFDDGPYVYENSIVSKGVTFEGIAWAFTHAHGANWHPLTTISHMLDCQVFGLQAGGQHLADVLLHAVGVVLLYFMLMEMTGALWRTAFVAAIFAIHPLRVESVAWISERKDVLSGIFFMLTLWAYARYARCPESRRRIAWVALWLALGLMSKPMLVTVPFVLLLLDYWPLGRLQAPSQLPILLREKIPLFLLSAVSSVATVIAQQSAIQPLVRFPFSLRVGNALVACSVYLGKMIYPAGLAVLYPIPKNGWPAWQVIAAALLLGGVTVLAFILRRKQPFWVVGWLWYLGMLVPVVGILQVGVQAYADRYTYLPQIGLSIAGTWGAAYWAGAWQHRRWVLGGAGGMVLGGLLFAAHHQATYWRDSEMLWQHTIGCTHDNPLPHYNLGMALRDQGRFEEAIAQYHEALRIDSAYVEVYNNLGNLLLQMGRIEEAITQYHEALRINPAYVECRTNLGAALLQQNRTTEAIAQWREALKICPDFTEALYNLGNALIQQGQTAEAMALYREAVRINPLYAQARNNLGYALLQQGRMDEAIVQFQEASRNNPNYVEPRKNLSKVQLQLRRTKEVLAPLREAVRVNPASAEAHYNFGSALLHYGQPHEAIAQLSEAVRIDPANAEAQNNLGGILFQQGQTEKAIFYFREAIRINPANAEAQNNLAIALRKEGRTEEAIAHAQKASELHRAGAAAASGLNHETLPDTKGK